MRSFSSAFKKLYVITARDTTGDLWLWRSRLGGWEFGDGSWILLEKDTFALSNPSFALNFVESEEQALKVVRALLKRDAEFWQDAMYDYENDEDLVVMRAATLRFQVFTTTGAKPNLTKRK